MPNNFTEAQMNALVQQLKKRLGLIKHFAKLGDSDDLQAAIVNEPGRPGFVRVRLEIDDVPYRVVKSGLLGAYSTYPGSPVIVGYDEKGDLAIEKADHDALVEAHVNPLIYNSAEPSVSAVNQTDGLLPLFCGAVSATQGTLTNEVFINPWRFVDETNTVRWFQGALLDLTSLVPGANLHRYVAIFILLDDLSIQVIGSTPIATITPLQENDKQEAFVGRDSDSVPISLWRLENSQTVVTNGNKIEDIRPWLVPPPVDNKKLKLGFENRTDSTLSYNEGTRTVTLAPTVAGTPYVYYVNGKRYSTTATVNLAHADVTDGYFFYFDETNTFVVSTAFWDLTLHAQVIFIFYNATMSEGIAFEERHEAEANPFAHLEFHEQIGTYRVSGFGASGFTVSPGAPTDADNTFALESGIIADEDLRHTLDALADNGPYFHLYRLGASGIWTWASAVIPFPTGGTFMQWNEFTGGAWQLTEMTNNNYANIWVIKVPGLLAVDQTFMLVDQSEHANLADAIAEDLSSIDWGTIPFQEFVVTHKITYRTNASYGSTGKVRIESFVELVLTREQAITSPGTDHNSLGGLQGGTTNEYYHLTSSEHTALSGGDGAQYNDITGANIVTSSTSFVSVSANYELAITTTGGDLIVGWSGSFAHSVAGQPVYFDIVVDGASEGGTDGVQFESVGAADAAILIGGTRRLTGLAADSYTIKLQWKVASGVATWFVNTGTAFTDIIPQFWVQEVS